MYRSAGARSTLSTSSRPKESGASNSRSSRSGVSKSGPSRGRSPRRSRSPSPRGRRNRSPSSSRSPRRGSPSPRRYRRRRSRSRSRSSSSSRRHSPGRHSHSSGRRSRSLERRSHSHSRSRSLDRCSYSPDRRCPSHHSDSSLEQSLQITVGNDRYGIDTPERRRLSDRLGSPVGSLSDVDRDDLADGPIFSRGLSRPRSPERYSYHEKSPIPYSMRRDDDHRSREFFLHQSDYSLKYDRLHDLPRDSDRDGEMHRKSLYSSEDRGRDTKRPRYDRNDRLLDESTDTQGFLPGTQNYHKVSLGRSRSPTYLHKDFQELKNARRKREEEDSRRLSRELSSSNYMIPGLTNPLQSSQPRYLYRPDEAPAMPKKSILKKRLDEPFVQPDAFASNSASIKEPPLLSNNPPLLQRSCTAPFSSEVETFLEQFNKNSAKSVNTDSQGNACDWRKHSGRQQNTFSFEQNFGSFLKQKEYHESTSESVDRLSDFLLPHERASQDGSGFSRILGMMADSTNIQEKRRHSFPDVEDEEKFLYGDDEDDSNINSPSTQNITVSDAKEPVSHKISSPSSSSAAVKPDAPEGPEYEKIHDLLKTIGLDIGIAEIGKLAARTQERLHGKKPSRSPDHHLVASHKPESQKMRRSRSDTRSPESMPKRSMSPGSYSSSKDISSVSKSEYNKTMVRDNPPGTPERSVPQVSLIPSAPPPTLLNLSPTPTSVSQYSVSRFSPFTATQLPPHYPTPTTAPPGYDAYEHYMAYAASGWPMYASPQQGEPTVSDVHGLVTLTVPPNPTRPNLRVIETVSAGKGTSEIKRDDSVRVPIPTTATYSKLHPQFSQSSIKGSMERVSDERNRALQKQKVIEEREKLKAEQEELQKKLHYLRTELERLSKQQGEMLRKKRREKDGHKDPLLVEVNRLQENIVKEIAQLQINAEATEKKQSELDKVAQILGINIFEKSRKQSAENKDSSDKNKSENAKSQEKTSSFTKDSKTSNDKPTNKSLWSTDSSSQSSKYFPVARIYDYYDTGKHWCKDCNIICGTLFDFFTHMHSKKHRQTLDPYNRPWASKTQTEIRQEITNRIDKIQLCAKGSEFLIPITGYYCQLCHEFFGDQISAVQHVKSHPHNEKFKKHLIDNPVYEKKWNMDRQAGLAVIQEKTRRLKRKQCEKTIQYRDENAKVSKQEEPKGDKELEEDEFSNMNDDSTSKKYAIKLKLKKDHKETEKEDKKEESQTESKHSSFGKFSWKKTEKEGKNQSKDESAEEGKDKESISQSGKLNSKPIAIKLSGKTVIPRTSRWGQIVPTSSQARIRPNLPGPVMVLRKNATTTVSKPAPLNTFLSIKSSGASTKPLPVVKEGNQEFVLPPDIISKAFGGEVVVLKGSQEDSKVPEQAEEQGQETVARAIEHAKALEQTSTKKQLPAAIVAKVQEQAKIVAKVQEQAKIVAKAQEQAKIVVKAQEQAKIVTKAQEQANMVAKTQEVLNNAAVAHEQAKIVATQEQAVLVAKAQAKARELATLVKEHEIARNENMQDQSLQQTHRRPLLPLPQGLRPSHLPLPTPVVYTSHRVWQPPSPPSILPEDELAPGVSEDDKNILAMPMCPRPLPPPTIFREQASKLEKKNSSLAAGNAKDLYDIFYSSGRNPVENKPANSLDKEKLNPTKREKNISVLADSKPSNSSSSQEILQNVHCSSNVSKILFGDRTPDTEIVKVEVCEENFEMASSIEEGSDNIFVSDAHSTFKNEEASESCNLSANASVSFQNVIMETTLQEEISSNPPKLESAMLTLQLPESSALPLDKVNKNPSVFQAADIKSSEDKGFIQLSEDSITLEDLTKMSSELDTVNVALQLPESSVLPLDEKVSKEPSEQEAAVGGEAEQEAMQLPEDSPPLDEVSNPSEFHAAEFIPCDGKDLIIQLTEDNVIAEDLAKKSSEVNTVKVDMQLPESSALSLDEVSTKTSDLETEELTFQIPESSASPLDEFSKKPSELTSSDDKEFTIQLSEDKVTSLEDITKLSSDQEKELAEQFPEIRVPILGEICKEKLEFETTEFNLSDGKEFFIKLSEDNVTLKDLTKKPPEMYATVEFATELPENCFSLDEISKKPSDLVTAEFVVSPLDEVSKKLPEVQAIELAMQLPEGSSPVVGEIFRKADDEDKDFAFQLPKHNVTILEDLSKKSSDLEAAVELAMQLPESDTGPLEEICKESLELEAAEFKSPNYEIVEKELQGRESDFSKESVSVRDVDMICENISQSHDQQNAEGHDGTNLKIIESDLQTKAYLIDLREKGRQHLELADHHFAVSQEHPESQLLKMQIDTHKGEGPILIEEKLSDNTSEVPVSSWVSETCEQNQLTWEPTNSAKTCENLQIVTDSKKSQLNLKRGDIAGLESTLYDKNPPTSEVQNMDPELKYLNKIQLDNLHTNSEDKELLSNSHSKDVEDFNVSDLRETQDVCLVNTTEISSLPEKHEENCQQPSNCEANNFPVKGTEDLGNNSSTNDVEPNSTMELIFIKNDKQSLSESDMELSDVVERDTTDKDIVNFSTVQPEIVQEPVHSLPTEFSVGNLEEEALDYTGMNTGILTTSTADDFDLKTTYSELNFDQSATLNMNLNVVSERDSPRSIELKSSGPSILKPGLELETIDFGLGDVKIECEHLDTLPSEILNEDTLGSPKLETVAFISLETSKTSELAIDQPGTNSSEPVVLTASDQEGKLCSFVSDIVAPASKSSTEEMGKPCFKMQDEPLVSEALLQAHSSKGGTPDTQLLNCDGKDLRNLKAECLESLHLNVKAASIEERGDNELFTVQNMVQTSAVQVHKSVDMEN